MRVAKICLSRPKEFKIGAWSIMKYQGQKWRDPRSYSHILVILEDEDVEEIAYQASHGLVHTCDLEVFFKENVIVKTYTLPREALNVKWMKKQLGKKYGYFQLIQIGIKFVLGIVSTGNGDKKFVCSEYVGRALNLSWVNDYTDPKQVDDYLSSIQA